MTNENMEKIGADLFRLLVDNAGNKITLSLANGIIITLANMNADQPHVAAPPPPDVAQ